MEKKSKIKQGKNVRKVEKTSFYGSQCSTGSDAAAAATLHSSQAKPSQLQRTDLLDSTFETWATRRR